MSHLLGLAKPSSEQHGALVPRANREIFQYSLALAPSEIAAISCLETIKSAGISIKDIDWVVAATQTPDFNNPGLASCLIKRLEIKHAAIIELKQPGCGAIYAIDLADSLVRSGAAKNVLVIAMDLLSRYFGEDTPTKVSAANARERFADGACSFLVSKNRAQGRSYRLLGTALRTTARLERSYFCHLPAADRFPQRLTPQDIEIGDHYPVLSPDEFELESVLLRSDIEQLRIRTAVDKSPFRFCIVDTPVPEKLTPFVAENFTESEIIVRKASSGYQGVAGAILPLLGAATKLQSSDRVCLLSLASGAAWGAAILEVEQ